MQSLRQAQHARRPGARSLARSRSGAVLLEVILALALFAFAAAVVSSSLHSAVERTARLHAQTHALDLAVSVLSEIQMGVRPLASAGPEPFEAPFEQWTWQVEVTPYSFDTEDTSGLQLVAVVVRNEDGTAVQRLTQLVAPPPAASAEDATGPSDSSTSGGSATTGSDSAFR